jgi:nucleotide-binding universal stress UspA family protein
MRILIAHDGSESADAAVADLARAGCPKGTEALVFSVADTWVPEGNADLNPEVARAFPALKTSRESAKAAMAAAQETVLRTADKIARLHPSWKVGHEARAGSPGWTIFDRAVTWKPHLVVVGSHGKGAWDRWTLGSVSHQVLLVCKGPVRIVRPKTVVEGSPKVLVAWDGSRGADLALRAAAGRVWPEGTEIRLLTAVDAPLLPRLERGGAEGWARRADKAAQGFRRPGRTVRSFTREGDPKRVLLEEAEAWKADSIFIGARGLTPWKSLILGSVSTAVAARAQCSVEIVRPGFWADAEVVSRKTSFTRR